MDIYVFINNERKSLRQLSAETGVAYETIYARWKNGVPADKLVELPEPELPLTKEEVVDALGYTPGMVNPNLLDNWYFGNPVNQQGQTEYVTEQNITYSIDRWMLGWNCVLSVNSDGASFTGGSNYELAQTIEASTLKAIEGKQVTLSALSRSGVLIWVTGIVTNGEFVANDNLRLQSFAGGATAFILMGMSDPLAAKLELGDTQTLAHLDEAGNWVLNEIPNYAEQMAVCSQYDPVTGEYKGVSSGSTIKKLWKNASPGSSFGAQTISLALSSYELVYIIVRHTTGDASICSTWIIPVGVGVYLDTFSGGQQIWRTASTSSTGITFGNCSYNNGYVLPLEIYGVTGVT